MTAEVMLFGDSMLARFTKDHIRHLERELGPAATVYNCAAGGWDSSDGARRAPLLARAGCDTVVLSFGANDCAPWKRVPIERFTENVAAVARAFSGARLVAFLPPRIEETGHPTRTNRDLDAYREALRAVVAADACLDTPRLLTGGLEADGLHLTARSYTALIPELARVITRGTPS